MKSRNSSSKPNPLRTTIQPLTPITIPQFSPSRSRPPFSPDSVSNPYPSPSPYPNVNTIQTQTQNLEREMLASISYHATDISTSSRGSRNRREMRKGERIALRREDASLGYWEQELELELAQGVESGSWARTGTGNGAMYELDLGSGSGNRSGYGTESELLTGNEGKRVSLYEDNHKRRRLGDGCSCGGGH